MVEMTLSEGKKMNYFFNLRDNYQPENRHKSGIFKDKNNVQTTAEQL